MVLWFCLSKGVSAAHSSQSNTPFTHKLDHSPAARLELVHEPVACSSPCPVVVIVVSVATDVEAYAGVGAVAWTEMGVEVEVGFGAVGAGDPALCTPNRISHRTTSRDGIKRGNDDDDDDDDADADDDSRDLVVVCELIIGCPVLNPTIEPVSDLVPCPELTRVIRDGDADGCNGRAGVDGCDEDEGACCRDNICWYKGNG